MTGTPRYVGIPWGVIDSQEYAALSPRAVQVLVMLWRQYDGFNNGEIPLGTPRAGRLCHCDQKTAWRAFQEIIDSGIATITDPGRPLPNGSNRESRWRINHAIENRGPTRHQRLQGGRHGCLQGGDPTDTNA
jgi:hypothetical protein